MSDVVLQAGHVFRTAGSTGTRAAGGRPTEQQVAWDICQQAAHILDRQGHHPTVIVADPASRTAYRGDCFIAVHCDGSTSTTARGASVGYRTPEGRVIAEAWQRAYAQRGWSGFRPANYTAALQGYYGTRRAVEQGTRTACIIEAGFLTNPGDAAQLSSTAGRERVALAIADAVNTIHPPTPRPEEYDDMHAGEVIASYIEAYGNPTKDQGRDMRAWIHDIYSKPTKAERDDGVLYLRDALGLA